MEVIEVAVITVATSICTFTMPLLFACQYDPLQHDEATDYERNFIQFNCPRGEYNQLATIFFTSQVEPAVQITFPP